MRKGRPQVFMIRSDQAPEAEAFQLVDNLGHAHRIMRKMYPDCIDSGENGWLPPNQELPPSYILPYLAGIGVFPDDWYDYEVHAIWISPEWMGQPSGAVAYVYRMRKEALADCKGR